LWKETTQLGRNRSALLTATLLPALILFLAPIQVLIQSRFFGSASFEQIAAAPLPGLASITGPNELLLQVVYPLLFVLGGLLLPTLTTTYAIIAERERRSLELLISLPVSVAEVLAAKILAVLIVTGLVGLPYVGLVIMLLMVVGIADASIIPSLLMPFVAAVVCATSGSLLLTLLARDFRSANNLNGALMIPVVIIAAVPILTVAGAARTYVVAALLLALAALALLAATRWITFERYLE
jgi:ABC-type Na+ efflux pump permease subunit